VAQAAAAIGTPVLGSDMISKRLLIIRVADIIFLTS